MKNFFASLGIIAVLCFFHASETSAYYCGSIACIENYVWCVTDSGLVKMNKLDGTYHIFRSIPGGGIVIDNYIEKWLIADEGVISFNEEGLVNPDNLEIKSYTTENGLVDNRVNQIAVDMNNVKWFATPSGVSSFDGTTWRTYTTEDGLTNNNVLSVAVDYRNVKWFGTRWDVSSYNDTTWTTHQFAFNDTTFNYISSIAVDSDNVVWFGVVRDGYYHALISLKGTSLKLHYNTFGTGWDYMFIIDIACGTDDTIWYIPYPPNLQTYDQKSGVVSFIRENEYYSSLFSINSVNVDDDGTVWIGTGEGLRSFDGESWTAYTFDFSETTVEAPETPSPFSINSVYPNPFNPSTTISFSIPKQDNVTLSVYDITGQKVATLVDKNMNAGSHSVKFDGTGLGSGVYLYRLESGGFEKMGKMLLMK